MGISFGVVRLLACLVDNGILGSGGAIGDASFRIFGNLLVALLRNSVTSALHSLGDVLGGILERLGEYSQRRIELM